MKIHNNAEILLRLDLKSAILICCHFGLVRYIDIFQIIILFQAGYRKVDGNAELLEDFTTTVYTRHVSKCFIKLTYK